MATLRDEVSAALTELGVLAEGAVPSAAMGATALAAVNRMIDQWAAEGMLFYVYLRTTFAIVANTQSYNVGLTQTVNAPRPISGEHIGRVSFYDPTVTPITEIPLAFLTDQLWQDFTQKTATAPYPVWWHYNPTFPVGVLSFYPIPTTALTGVLYAPQAISEFTALSDTVSMPPGYRECLVTNLAINLASSYGKEPSASLERRAAYAKAIVKRSNTRMVSMTFPADALISDNRGSGYSILTDTNQ